MPPLIRPSFNQAYRVDHIFPFALTEFPLGQLVQYFANALSVLFFEPCLSPSSSGITDPAIWERHSGHRSNAASPARTTTFPNGQPPPSRQFYRPQSEIHQETPSHVLLRLLVQASAKHRVP